MLGEKLDEIFADFSDSTPGCSVGVIRSGEIVAARGYGQAQLEYGLPIVADGTIFHVASVSKQFTAFAVTLLSFERPEILQLDDPVSKHLPWLPELGSSATVRQMMHHTSGIRDQWELLVMGGWRMDDVLTTDMILNLMRRQRELNFPPGSEYMYCNMGYLLLAQVVEAVSGVSFAAFCDQRIFGPLRMTRTHIHDDHERIVPGRAYSYKPAGENRFKKAILSYANAGATSLFTTATDLLFWLDNFRTATVGGHAVMSAMTSLGVLTSGETIDYAHGVTVTEHRGLQVIGHSGADAGFRAQVPIPVCIPCSRTRSLSRVYRQQLLCSSQLSVLTSLS
jgi:CubicO group peptidase (beta-lactamase class C family)